MKRNYFFKPALLLIACSFYFLEIRAQWSTNPDIDDTLNATVYDPLTFCSDGHGGAFFAWTQTFTGVTHDVIVNRIDSLGYLRFGDSGMIIHSDGSGVIASGAPNICEDGKGGFYIAYTNNALTGHPLVCHHLDSTGASLWSDTGTLVTQQFAAQYYQASADLINDGGNGVMMSFVTNGGANTGLYAQRLDFDGNKQWGTNGKSIQLGADHRFPRVISDGNQGIAVAWANYSYDGQGFNYSLRVDCLDHNGTSRFPSGSRKLNQTTNIGFGCFYRLVLTANKNFIVSWLRDGINTPTLFAQKVNASGDFLWGATEIKVRDTTGEVRNFDMMSDGNEGAWYTWVDGRKVGIAYGQFAQHINGDSTKDWAPQGVRVDSSITSNYGYLAPDINGQVKVFWVPSPDNKIHMQQLNNTGALLLPGNGVVLTPNGHVPFFYRSILHVSGYHDILFLRLGNGKCFAKYVPFNTVLPLKLLSFGAVNTGKSNLLTWQTAFEINTAYFSVERSEDGIIFYEVAKIKNGNNTAGNHYSYEDIPLSNATIYYRLKEVDTDGKFVYSKIIRLHQNIAGSMKIVPNPAYKKCTVYFDVTIADNAVLKIFGMDGRQHKQITLHAGQQGTDLDLSSFSPGIYICRLDIGDEIFTQKLMVAN